MRRILFVDDEPAILEGLRNLLRKQRRTWDMAFAESGQAALGIMASAPADIVVSDMRMPRCCRGSSRTIREPSGSSCPDMPIAKRSFGLCP
jgi:CheY-like chemotaxis protein